MIVAERLISGNNKSSKPMLNGFRQLGIEVALFPVPLVSELSLQGEEKGKVHGNDHLDRVSCLLFGRDGKRHLLIESGICTCEFINPNDKKKDDIRVLDPKESLGRIEEMCKGFGIKLHCIDGTTVPYALNIPQFPDGTVTISGGEESLFETVAGIVGKEKVISTRIPILFLPLLARAGTRCLVNAMPEALAKNV